MSTCSCSFSYSYSSALLVSRRSFVLLVLRSPNQGFSAAFTAQYAGLGCMCMS